MTKHCTRRLLATLPHAPSTLHVVAPADLGLRLLEILLRNPFTLISTILRP